MSMCGATSINNLDPWLCVGCPDFESCDLSTDCFVSYAEGDDDAEED